MNDYQIRLHGLIQRLEAMGCWGLAGALRKILEESLCG